MNKIDEIKKLAGLLSEGAITQEEFEVLKKEIITKSKPIKSEYVPYVSKVKHDTLIKNTYDTYEPIEDSGSYSWNGKEYVNALGKTSGSSQKSKTQKTNRTEGLDILKRAGAKELPNNQKLTFKGLKLIGIFVGLIFLVGWCVNIKPSSSNSSSDASSQYAELHCSWCQKVQKSSGGQGLVYYEWVDGGVSWNQFYDGIKYKCCSESCCRLFNAANSN